LDRVLLGSWLCGKSFGDLAQIIGLLLKSQVQNSQAILFYPDMQPTILGFLVTTF
jgi:hypothetical protein